MRHGHPRILAGALPALPGPPADDGGSPEEFLLSGESKGWGALRWPVWTPCQCCNPRVMLWHQACPGCVAPPAGSWEWPAPFLQLQPQEQWFVTGGARTWGRMAAPHVHLQLPACSHQLALLSVRAAAQALRDCRSRHEAGATVSEHECPPFLSFHLLAEG